MRTQLLTLSKIFTERLFRIPDYQRGYAWTEKQLKDFWNDIQQLDSDHNHYAGVLTLEDVPEDVYQRWEDDLWIINAKSFQPFFVVDGQQRLTTAIILIQTILEHTNEDRINFTEPADIRRRFIFDSKDDGISRSYVFGYEKDNPSYEFLKTKIFCERSSSSRYEDTIYTQNLARAKDYFDTRVKPLSLAAREQLYRKVTQQLLFNIFTITDDVDVCVAFETMNNRGKALSYLELLKNRLIYLSLKFDAPPYEQEKLRRSINDCWKSLYHNLGRNKDTPLDDDHFLFTHYIIYFGKDLVDQTAENNRQRYRRLYRSDYSSYLLEDRFIPKNVTPAAAPGDKLDLQDVYQYVSSLQDSIEIWYKIWNPVGSDLPQSVQSWLDKINRNGAKDYLPLILVALKSSTATGRLVALLQAVERQLFVLLLARRHFGFMHPLDLNPIVLEWTIELGERRTSIEKLTKQISDRTDSLLQASGFIKDIVTRFRGDGFYSWDGIRYFLFEYNLHLQGRSKTKRPKIFWPEFTEEKNDFLTVEHIYPRQARHSYWTSRFKGLTQKQRTSVRNSLGNLLPLSRAKNASISNSPFPEKVDGRKDVVVGYRYGSYAENEVSTESEWTPSHILSRGLRLLAFMEQRWGIQLGAESDKIKMLGLDSVAALKARARRVAKSSD